MAPDFSNGYALIIGVGNDLPTTVQDAHGLQELLIDPDYAAYPHGQVALIVEDKASRQGILNAFDGFIQKVNQNPDATAIIYFSGHGGLFESAGTASGYFLVPFDYDPGRFQETTISSIEFTEKIQQIKSRKMVLLLDCCHAAGMPVVKSPGAKFVKHPLPFDLVERLNQGTGRVIIASSHANEYSYIGQKYSIFTECLLEALQGKVTPDRDGYVRILETLIYLYDEVPKRAPGPQHPFVKKILDLGDNFPVCYYPASDKSPGRARVPADDPHAYPAKLRVDRLQSEIDSLQEEFELRAEKIGRMRAALAVETAITVKFQLEKLVLDEESQLAYLKDRLAELEQALQAL
jgi:hypothetical protein